MEPDPAIEAIAAVVHDEWVSWATTLLKSKTDKLSEERRARWARLVVSSYAELTEEEKDHDRKWAHKILEALTVRDFHVLPSSQVKNP